MRVHAIQTGENIGNEPFMRSGCRWRSNLFRRRPMRFPVYSYLLEHPEGMIAIDTGSTARWEVSRIQHRVMSLPPIPVTTPDQEIGPQMREKGFDPGEVQKVVLTHLDVDHTGGVGHFPQAEHIVHRPEHEMAAKIPGKVRYKPKLWPSWFEPTVVDLEPEPEGPFPASRAVTAAGDVRLVPLEGHTVGQVGVVVDDDPPLFFPADHVLCQDWLVEDISAGGDHRGLLMQPRTGAETGPRIRKYLADRPSVFLPAHDSDAPSRLERREVLSLA